MFEGQRVGNGQVLVDQAMARTRSDEDDLELAATEARSPADSAWLPSVPRTATRRSAAAVADEPRLEQFPSPQPLSEQEEMLARYVQ